MLHELMFYRLLNRLPEGSQVSIFINQLHMSEVMWCMQTNECVVFVCSR